MAGLQAEVTRSHSDWHMPFVAMSKRELPQRGHESMHVISIKTVIHASGITFVHPNGD